MEFQQLIQKRRSVRAYSAGNPVTDEELNALMEAVRQAPTWKNTQTGRYYIVRTPDVLNEVRANALPGFNQKSSANASVLIVTAFVRDTAGFTAGNADNEPGNMWGSYDLGLQNAYLVLKAADLGLDTLIMGLRNADYLRGKLGIPANEEVMSVIAVGHRDGEPVLKVRKSAEEISKKF